MFGGKVTKVQSKIGNMAIPSGGYVLSGHGTSSTWLASNAKVGTTVNRSDNSTSTSPPDPAAAVLHPRRRPATRTSPPCSRSRG